MIAVVILLQVNYKYSENVVVINGHMFYHFAIGRGFHFPCNRANASGEKKKKKKENETFQVACK